MEHIKIKKIQFLDNFIIEILLCNGKEILYDFKPKLETSRFIEIANKDKFKKGRIIKNKMIRWDESTEISLSEIMLHAKSKQCL